MLCTVSALDVACRCLIPLVLYCRVFVLLFVWFSFRPSSLDAVVSQGTSLLRVSSGLLPASTFALRGSNPSSPHLPPLLCID